MVRWFFLFLLLCSCRTRSSTAGVTSVVVVEPAPDPALVAEGRRWIEHFQCNRCHTIEGVAPPEASQDCVACHRSVRAGTFAARPEHLTEWRNNLQDLIDAPTLIGAEHRFHRAWIERFLLAPSDVRPHLRATMPRLAIDASKARALAAFLGNTTGAREDPAVRSETAVVARGRELFREKQCGRCHVFRDAALPENAFTVDPSLSDAARLAPDLSITRDRFRRDVLVSWIQNPAQMRPGTAMPSMGLSLEEARSLAAYVLHAPLRSARPREVPPMLPVLSRRVVWSEVEAGVFHRTCRHCHADESFALGDGGPGNTGGFGFAPRRLNLNSYAGTLSGMLVGSERQSIFAVDASGMPRILHALRARQLEEAGQIDPDVRGMPLGHPALTSEQIQLVASWIASGRPLE